MHRPPPAKKGACDQALGRSKGGLTSKWHIAVDSFGRPVRFILTGGNASDPKFAIPLMTGLHARHVLADKAYDSYAILNHIEENVAKPIIPRRVCMPRPRAFDPVIYKLRNRIERTIGHLKQLRRIATRYDRLPANYLAGLYIASINFWC
jgi:transposase